MEIFLSCIDVFLRSLFSLVALFFFSKLVGARQISQMTFFDYIVGITIGSIAAVAAIEQDVPFYLAILSVAIYTICTLGIAWLTDKSIILRRFFTGVPKLLIDNGIIIEQNLKKNRVDVNELLSCARVQGYFDIKNIAYAVMESNGKISFLPRGDNRPLTPADMSLHPQDAILCANVIIDGRLMEYNLGRINKTEKWLETEMKKQGYSHYAEILLATCDESGTLAIFPRNGKPTKGYFI